MPRIVTVTRDEIDLTDLVRTLTTSDCGAVLTFLGVVRDHAGGRRVASIEYTAYEEMAESELRAVVDRVADEHRVENVAVVHRIGHLEVGETSLGVVVASPHRREAFGCGLAIIDELKKTVPVWKKEIGPDGSHWV